MGDEAVPTNNVWEIAEREYPAAAPIQVRLRFLLRYAILAPSVKNTQPWRFAVQGNRVCLFAARTGGLSVTDPDRRELYISLGCALENLLVAGEHFGLGHEVTYFPEGSDAALAAAVLFTPGGTASASRAGIRLDAILRRHNDNSVFQPVPVPVELRARLEACREDTGLRLELADDRFFRRWVNGLTSEADRLEFANPEFREELGYWIGRGAFGAPRLLSRLGQLLVSRVDLGESVARQDRKIVGSAALIGLVAARDDTHLTHLRTGQLFERLWLTATMLGVSIHPMSQTMRLPQLRAAVAELLPEPGWMPQHLFRVGFSSRRETPHRTPRRPVGEVLLG